MTKERRILWFLGGSLVLGLLLHLTIRDRVPLVSVLFYAMPRPLLALGFLVFGAWLAWMQRSPWGLVPMVVGCAVAGWWITSSFKGDSPRADAGISGDEIKVLYWNMARQSHPSAALIDLVREHDSDVVALGEAGEITKQAEAAYGKQLPGYDLHRLDHGMACFARQKVASGGVVEIGGDSAYHGLAIGAVDPIQLVVIDVTPNPFANRHAVLERILADFQDHGPLILVGDFNTPIESAGFDVFREKLVHAFSEAGVGFRETWPLGVPLLSLDHLWHSKDLTSLRVKKAQRRGSDHDFIAANLLKNSGSTGKSAAKTTKIGVSCDLIVDLPLECF